MSSTRCVTRLSGHRRGDTEGSLRAGGAGGTSPGGGGPAVHVCGHTVACDPGLVRAAVGAR